MQKARDWIYGDVAMSYFQYIYWHKTWWYTDEKSVDCGVI